MQSDILKKGTVSHHDIRLQVRDTDIRLELKRHLAPRTVRIILQSLPMEGNAHHMDDIVYINTDVKSGRERVRDRFKANEVAFLPAQKCLCFFTRDSSDKRMTPVGIMHGDTSILETVKSGDVLRIYEAV